MDHFANITQELARNAELQILLHRIWMSWVKGESLHPLGWQRKSCTVYPSCCTSISPRHFIPFLHVLFPLPVSTASSPSSAPLEHFFPSVKTTLWWFSPIFPKKSRRIPPLWSHSTLSVHTIFHQNYVFRVSITVNCLSLPGGSSPYSLGISRVPGSTEGWSMYLIYLGIFSI